MPFLTVFTRHLPERRDLLSRCKRSLAAQTCQDYQHLIITDDSSYNVHEADKLFHLHRDSVKGKFVHMLDDDDFLVDNRFIEDIREIVRKHDPDVIITKMERAIPSFNDTLPPNDLWGKRPVAGKIGAPCLIVRASIWYEHCSLFGWPTRGHGDHCLIATLWDKGYRFYWTDRVAVRVDQIGHRR
jgi:hypothetical protein